MYKNYNYPYQGYGGMGNNGQFYPVFPQHPQPPQQVPTLPPLALFAVNGIEGAKAYILPPSQSAYLIDSDAPYLYLKEADAQGKCALKAFSITEVQLEEVNKSRQLDTSQFATKSDIEALERKLVATFRSSQEEAAVQAAPNPQL